MRKLLHIRNLLFALLIIYSLQGVLYTQGSIISQGSLFLYYAISGFYFVKVIITKHKKNMFLNAWTALLIINILGYIFTANYSRDLGMFKGVLMSLLSFYPFYYMSRNGELKSKHLIYLLFILIPVTISSFYFNRIQVLSELSYERIDIVNNIAYNFVSLIPLVFLIKKNRLLSVSVMLVLIFFIIQGGKRGAIVVGALGLLMYIYYQMRIVNKKYKVRGYILISIVAVVIGYFAYDMFISNEYLISRMEQMVEGNVSGRDQIYANIFNGWLNSDSLPKLLFGYGFAGSRQLSGTGNFAHNDWLELLSNFGLLGVSIYIVLFYSIFKIIRYSNWKADKNILFLTIMGMWFTTTLFSMAYTSMGGYLNAMMLAYLLGSRSKNLV